MKFEPLLEPAALELEAAYPFGQVGSLDLFIARMLEFNVTPAAVEAVRRMLELWHAAEDTSLSSQRSSENDTSASGSTSPGPLSNLHIAMAGIGVSILDAEAAEVGHATFSNIFSSRKEGPENTRLNFWMNRIQVDNCLSGARYKVILHRSPPAEREVPALPEQNDLLITLVLAKQTSPPSKSANSAPNPAKQSILVKEAIVELAKMSGNVELDFMQALDELFPISPPMPTPAQ